MVEIDWADNRIRFHEPSTYEAPEDLGVLPLESRYGMIFVPAGVTVDGKTESVKLFVDTGAPNALIMGSKRCVVSILA